MRGLGSVWKSVNASAKVELLVMLLKSIPKDLAVYLRFGGLGETPIGLID